MTKHTLGFKTKEKTTYAVQHISRTSERISLEYENHQYTTEHGKIQKWKSYFLIQRKSLSSKF